MTTATPPRPTHATESRRAPAAARRVGYLLGLAVNLLVLWLVTVRPGWRIVPFLTERFVDVVELVIISLLVGAALNLLYLAADPRWLKSLGDAVSAGIGCAVLYRLWAIFPFDLGERFAGWGPALRIVLVLGVIGCGIGVVANVAQAVRTTVPPVPPASSLRG
jgi:hypothetical protein